MATGRSVEMRLWLVPAADIPAGADERIDWLFRWWRRIDAWIEDRQPARA